MSSNATCTCTVTNGDECHLGEGCRAMEKVRRLSPTPNFCSRCGKRLTPEGVHTCTPPMSRDAELEQARTLAATAEKWRGLETAKFGDGRTVQEIQREAAEEEREACAKVCEGPVGGTTQSREWWDGFKTATRQCAEMIRARRRQ